MVIQGSREPRKHENYKIKKDLGSDSLISIDQISILYTNMDSYTNKINNFKQYLACESLKPYVIILTEINAKNYKYPLLESEMQINGYNLFLTNLNNKDRGIAVYVDVNLNCLQLDDFSTFNEHLALIISGKTKQLNVFAIYRSPNSSLDNDELLFND